MKPADPQDVMSKLVTWAELGVKVGHGPFAACIVDSANGAQLSIARNSVVHKRDATAHAEVEAIRQACAKLNRVSLRGATLYTTCEPCPMCFGAIYWARLDRVYYASTKVDAGLAGFSDLDIYQDMIDYKVDREHQRIPFSKVGNGASVFSAWRQLQEKVPY